LTRHCQFFCGLVMLIAVAGCSAGSGEGLNISGRPLSEGANIPLAPTLESIQANVFDPSCIICHSGASAALGLRLDSANSFTNLVGVTSVQNSSLARVEPGSPDQSYLILKLEGRASKGQQMPLGGPPIPQSTIDFVRQWITDGAQPVAGPMPTTAPVVVSITPGPDALIATLPSQIVAAFDQDIDASTVNNMTFVLRASGGDDLFDNGNDVPVVSSLVVLSMINPRLASFDLSGVSPVEDLYRVTLRGAGPSVILGLNGLSLDGEFTGALPSGDGTEGGDFRVEFELRGVQPTLQSIQDNVFTPSCGVSGCHTGPTGPVLPGGMDLSNAAASFASLVGVTSIEQPPELRVAANDADASYLIQKVEGRAAVGAQMPLGGQALDQETIDAIRAWIDQGASP